MAVERIYMDCLQYCSEEDEKLFELIILWEEINVTTRVVILMNLN